MPSPSVSILIPNFNNGRESSRSGRDNLIAALLESLHSTLSDDPADLEILAYDDGSSDDSLATLRQWARRTWRGGRPFLELIEAPHCGYLSRIANVLSRRARGQFLVRLDGDIVCLTPGWASLMLQAFAQLPADVGVIGPKQLRPDGRIHACGDFILHPNGYSHVASGLPRQAVRHCLEVDHIMGCFYCCRKQVFDDVGGYDERFLRGQTEDLSLRARLKGWRAVAVPQFEFLHQHVLRKSRATEADSPQGVAHTLEVFERKWGFSRLAADLDVVRRLYAGTPLLWNPRVFGSEALGFRGQGRMPTLERSEWALYASHPHFRDKVNMRVGLALAASRQGRSPQRPVLLGAGEGLTAHLLALNGLPCLAVDEGPERLDFARRMVADQTYPAGPPRFQLLTDPAVLPLDSHSADLLMVCDLIERHPNPVALLREAGRVLQPHRLMVLVSQRRGEMDDPTDPTSLAGPPGEHRFLWMELLNLLQAANEWEMLVDVRDDDSARDMYVAARRQLPGAQRQTPPVEMLQHLTRPAA